MRASTALIFFVLVSIVAGSLAWGCYRAVAQCADRVACAIEGVK